MNTLIRHFTYDPDTIFMITFGFFDTQTNFFQKCIPRTLIHKIQESFRDDPLVKNTIPIVECYGNTVHYTIENTMWDLQVQKVHTRQQAIFISDSSIQIIVGVHFLRNITPFFEKFVTNFSETINLQHSSAFRFLELN